tara:strand:- start:1791 stop:2237 length:447 start_codon:yes stop_codon:yes gene_type:complete
MDCSVCYDNWENEEYNDLDEDEKAQTITCKICKTFVCISCLHQMRGENKVWTQCPVCRNVDYKHYFEEDVLWWIKHHSLDYGFLTDDIVSIYHHKLNRDIVPISLIMDKYINSNHLKINPKIEKRFIMNKYFEDWSNSFKLYKLFKNT